MNQQPRQPQAHKKAPRRQQRLLYGCLSTILVLIIGATHSVAWGQVPNGATELLPSPFRQLEDNLPGLNRLLDSDSPEIARDVIWLDGRKLFTIAVPVVKDNENAQAENLSPAESRVQIIENRLERIVNGGFEPNSLEVLAETDSNSRQPIIYVRYTQDGEAKEDELLTVTALDAEINGTDAQNWAEQISSTVEEALITAQQERQPGSLQQRGLWAVGLLLITAILSLGLSLWQQRLRKERKNLSAQSKSHSNAIAASTTGPPVSPESTTVLLQRRTENQQKQRFNDIKWRLSQLSQLLIWGTGIFLIVGLFPYTRWLQPWMLRWVQIPIRLLLIVLLTYLAIRLGEILVDRLFWALQSSTSMATDTSQRLMLRFTTFSRVAKSIVVLVCGGIGILTAISALGIEINPALLTVAGIIGVGISLASQNLIKDVINGFLILLEDQYGVGDVVTIGTASGFVENMNLRITQLRNTEGHLITIPNSAITVVQNLSKEWSRVDLSISVAYDADLDQALTVTEQIAQQMSRDPLWKDLILEPPQLLGVDNLDYVGATIRLWIKTQPLKQWDVAREYRRRLKLAFDRAGIPIGVPQQSLWVSNAPETAHHSTHHQQELLREAAKEQKKQEDRANSSASP